MPSRFSDLELLGEGAMGRVFKAYDRERGTSVALKVVRARGADDQRRFAHEARLLSRLHHESIVRLFDVGIAGEDLFFTMELLEGISLEALLGRPPPPVGECKWVFVVASKVLDALQYLHSKGFLHKDVKPSNVMILARPGLPPAAEALLEDPDPAVKLLDFGLALERDGQGGAEGQRSGTLLYMSPEGLQGLPSIDERSDIYSVGAVLYHFVARRPPFTSLCAALNRRGSPASPGLFCPGCPEPFSAAILHFLDHEPHRRPSSAAEARDLVLSLLDPGRRKAVSAPRLLPPSFVGRSEELRKAGELLEGACRGRGACFQVAAERGAGKTWFLEQSDLRSQATVDLGMVCLRGAFQRSGQGLHGVFAGLLELSKDRGAPLADTGGQEAAADLLRLALRAGWARAEGHGASPLMDVEGNQPSAVLRERLHAALIEVLRAASSSRPIFLILEDAQHADEWEVEFLGRCARSISALRVAVALTYRPEAVAPSSPLGKLLEELEAAGSSSKIVLGGLTDLDVKKLTECRLWPAGEASPELVAYLSRSCSGMPLAVTRALQELWERGCLAFEDGSWRLKEGLPGISREWKDRLLTLDRDDLCIISAAAVLEMPFEEALVARLLSENLAGQPPAPQDLRSRISSLVRRGFLAEHPDGLSLPSDLDEGHLAGIVSSEDLKELHARAGPVLVEWFSGAPESHSFRIARHFERAGSLAEACELYLAAARAAGSIYANRRGVEAYQRALDVCSSISRKRQIAEELGELHARVGEYPVALECFRLAKSLAETERSARDGRAQGPAAPDTSREVDLLDKIGRVLHGQGELAEALSIFSRCLEMAVSRPAERALALFRIGGVHLDRGDGATAMGYLEESLRIYEELGDPRQMAIVQSGLGLAEKNQDRLDRAIQRFEEAFKNAEKAGSLLEMAYTLNNLGNTHRARGDDRGALDCLRRSIEVRERIGDRRGVAICLNSIARVHSFRGELSAARGATERSLGIFEEIGDKKGVLVARCNLGELAHLLSSFDEASAILRKNLEAAEELRVLRLLEATLCNLGNLEIDRGEYSRAAEFLRRSLKTLPAEKPLDLRAQALGSLAAALLRMDHIEEAEDALREALDVARAVKLREKLGLLASCQLRLLLDKGDPEGALKVAKAFTAEMDKGVEKHGVAQYHRELGRVYRELGPDWADLTEKHLKTALKMFESMGGIHNAAITRMELGVYWRLLGELSEAESLFQQAEEELKRVGAGRRLEEFQAARRRA